MLQFWHVYLADLFPFAIWNLFLFASINHFFILFSVLLTRCALAQNQVQIQFQTDPLVAQTGTEVVFTVLTVSQVLSMTWVYKGQTLGLWAGGSPVINPVDQFLGRITISANQLRIGGAQLRDKGNFTVQVIPTATTGLAPNSKSVQLTVFGKR